MTLVTRDFFTKKHVLKNAPKQVQKTKSLLKVPKLSLHSIKKNNYSVYIPTPIWQTRYSEFWQWQRVSEWHREYGQDEIINEKRHILM